MSTIQPPKNVHDFLKSLAVDEIKEYCQRKTIPFSAAMMQINGDFNFGTVIRNANFFGLEKVYYIGGSRQYDRRPTVGAHHYTPIEYYPDEISFFKQIEKTNKIIAVENNVKFDCIPYQEFEYEENSVFLFGEEQRGLSNEVLTRCHGIITIEAHGSVRSLNVGTASGIIMSHVRNYFESNL